MCIRDSSCIPFAYGCTDPIAWNYDSAANTDDGSCIPFIYGCNDSSACNYDEQVNTYDGSCWYAETYYDCNGICLEDLDNDGVCDDLEIFGCTDETSLNYDQLATEDDNSCIDIVLGCISSAAYNYNEDANTCLLYTSPSPRDRTRSRMPSSA